MHHGGEGLDKVSEEAWRRMDGSHLCHWRGTEANWMTCWCFALPMCSRRSHVQLPGPSTAWGCPCHPHSPHLHSRGKKKTLTLVTQRAARWWGVKHWVNVNNSQEESWLYLWRAFDHSSSAQVMEGEEDCFKVARSYFCPCFWCWKLFQMRTKDSLQHTYLLKM